MSRAAQLRSDLESSLEPRIPSAFSPQARTEQPTIPTGIPHLDALLDGGLPLGAITEIVGSPSSGRLTCTNAFLSQVIQAGQVCAWVDVSDSFDPESAAAGGIDLDRLLWVRCCEELKTTEARHAERLSPSTAPPAGRPPRSDLQPLSSGGSPHPRSEVRGLSQALDTLLTRKPLPRRNRQIGTPGAPNRGLDSRDRVEQVASDRLPSRRGAHLLHQRVAAVTSAPSVAATQATVPFKRQQKPWSRLDQALRAADLLLQAGGFGALVLDLGGIDPQFATRVPLATWFRFRAAADRSRTAFLLLSQVACAQSSAEVVLRCSLSLPHAGTVLTTLPFTVERLRQRFTAPASNVISMRKPPQRVTAVEWQAQTLWATGR